MLKGEKTTDDEWLIFLKQNNSKQQENWASPVLRESRL
jgi:hypothetical protein